MGSNNFKFFLPLYSFLLIQTLVHAQNDDLCKKIDCGRGTCVVNGSSFLGFDCICYSGWKQFQLGSYTLPPCVIPDCKLDFHCGSTPAPPPPPSFPPPFNILDPCSIVWCGDGSCHPDGIGHSCQCFQGSANLFNITALPCFKNCGIGANCSSVELGPLYSESPPPPQSNASPPSPQSRYSSPFGAVKFILLPAIIMVSTLFGH